MHGTRENDAVSLCVLILRYSVFAIVATLANLGSQRMILFFGDTIMHFSLALIGGTCAGLAVKYSLDKKWIFHDAEQGLNAHSRKFVLYTAMGIFTTAIFWGLEGFAWYLWHTEMARETGATIGLIIGYIVKYQLDRRFVFTDTRLKAEQ